MASLHPARRRLLPVYYKSKPGFLQGIQKTAQGSFTKHGKERYTVRSEPARRRIISSTIGKYHEVTQLPAKKRKVPHDNPCCFFQ